MSQKPTALVIGAGIGGIATAARLAKNGYEVTVLEKESTHPGTGLPIVLLSARLTTERILKESVTIPEQKVVKHRLTLAQG